MSQQPLPLPLQPPRTSGARARAVAAPVEQATERLDRVGRGRVVRVVSIENETDGDPIARRLDDLGLRVGVIVRVLRRAPLGDPTVYELHGYQLCLRRSESARVRVEPLPAEARDSLRR